MENAKHRLRSLFDGLTPRLHDFRNKKPNEANTKALVIEPILKALGWNLLDLDEVEREFRVFDNTLIDYSLRIDKPVLFLEAKAFGAKRDDKAFIAQAVNYANNEGVVWCVLTNGRSWRVYKSNEPVPMDRKLLFEVNLAPTDEEDGPPPDAIDRIALLSRESLEAGVLDRYGESIFTDSRVRAALSRLNHELPERYVSLVRESIEGDLDPAAIRESLRRIEAAAPIRLPRSNTRKVGKNKVSRPTKSGSKYDLDHHLAGKPENIRLLYQEFHEEVMRIAADIERRFAKHYVSYRRKRSFTTTELQNSKILLYFGLPPAEAPDWDDEVMRDVTKIGHFGMGDTEFVLTRSEQIPKAIELSRLAYQRQGA